MIFKPRLNKICQVWNTKTRKQRKPQLTVRHWNFATGETEILISSPFSPPLPLPSSEEDAEFVFLGTTTSISLFYSLILIQSSKTWIVPVLVYLVCVCACACASPLLHSFASWNTLSVIPPTHVACFVVGISYWAARVTRSNQNARVEHTNTHLPTAEIGLPMVHANN
jgi:hypothetical protein